MAGIGRRKGVWPDDCVAADGATGTIRERAAQATEVFDLQHGWADCSACASRGVSHRWSRLAKVAGPNAAASNLIACEKRPLRRQAIENRWRCVPSSSPEAESEQKSEPIAALGAEIPANPFGSQEIQFGLQRFAMQSALGRSWPPPYQRITGVAVSFISLRPFFLQ